MKIALIGYGEVGRILAEDLRAGRAMRSRAYDVKLDTEAGNALRDHAARTGVALGADAAGAVRGAALVSAPSPPARPWPVADACAPGLDPGAFFLDFNSASPGAKMPRRGHSSAPQAAAMSKAR
jgi:prephenate dehydrogenase